MIAEKKEKEEKGRRKKRKKMKKKRRVKREEIRGRKTAKKGNNPHIKNAALDKRH